MASTASRRGVPQPKGPFPPFSWDKPQQPLEVTLDLHLGSAQLLMQLHVDLGRRIGPGKGNNFQLLLPLPGSELPFSPVTCLFLLPPALLPPSPTPFHLLSGTLSALLGRWQLTGATCLHQPHVTSADLGQEGGTGWGWVG